MMNKLFEWLSKYRDEIEFFGGAANIFGAVACLLTDQYIFGFMFMCLGVTMILDSFMEKSQ